VVEGEAAFAGEPYAEEYDSRGRDRRLLNGVRDRRLDYLGRGMAYRTIRMCQAICMKMRLLNRGAHKKKNRAHDGKQKMSAHFDCPILTAFSHLYRDTIRHFNDNSEAAERRHKLF
jgi:hypothetical protein